MGGVFPFFGNCANAQITPDSTLPNNSNVTPDGSTFNITGGTQAGGNLFHSFKEFSVPSGGTAFFNNAVDIQNIISRVTGGSVSNIDGLIRANGTANLFLINPNGIIFGSNASLNIGGSFVASTASAIQFGNQGLFSADNPNTPPLLTVNPSAFLFNQIVTAGIQNNSLVPVKFDSLGRPISRGLRVPDNRSLLLVGGDIRIDGGGLNAVGGRIDLGGLAEPGTVGLNVDGNNLRLSFPDTVARADVSLTNKAIVESSGDIQVQGRRVTLTDGSRIQISDFFNKVGNLTVTASDSVKLSGNSADGTGSRLSTSSGDTGGNLTITTGRLIVQDGGRVTTFTGGRSTSVYKKTSIKQGGELTVTARDSVELSGKESGFFGSSSGLSTSNYGPGVGGDLTIVTKRLSVRDGASITTFAGVGSGDAGNLTVSASDSVELIGSSAGGYGLGGSLISRKGQYLSGLSTEVTSSGDAGKINITTGRLLVKDGARVSASTFGSGAGGQLVVNARDSVELIGTTVDGQLRSGLFATSYGFGNSGDLAIITRQLNVQDRAQVSVSSQGVGNAGSINVVARSIHLDNQTALTANSAKGKGGNIELRAGDLLTLRRNTLISAVSGNDSVNRFDENQLTGFGRYVISFGNNGLDGNINIDTKFLVAVPSENSDIVATGLGRTPGSNIQVNAQGIFGTQFRQQQTSKSDIVATGQVTLNTPNVDLNRGLVQLPTKLVDISQQIDTGCNPGSKQRASSFVITGRGGLPPNPSDMLTPDAVFVDWVTLNPSSDNRSTPSVTTPTIPTPEPIVEATGWVRDSKGEVILTANAATTPHGSWQKPVSCRAF
jgi:filamentous hemagglutinin family protein